MARITVEDCIRHYPNRFEMVLLASRRARQLLNGMPGLTGEDPHKPSVQALKEIGEGHLSWERLFDLDEQERQRLQALEAEESEEAE